MLLKLGVTCSRHEQAVFADHLHLVSTNGSSTTPLPLYSAPFVGSFQSAIKRAQLVSSVREP